MRSITAPWALLLCAAPSQGQGLPAQSERTAAYRIEARLDADARTVTAHQTIDYRNRSQAAVAEVRFHLYLNAFRPDSTLFREAGKEFRENYQDPSEYGELTVTALSAGEQNTDITASLRHLAPDDGNPDDRTVLAAQLPSPVAPGESIRLALQWHSKVPKAWRRTGWAPGRFFMMVHWFPKLGVLEPDGTWNCHQFHATTEFFADFAVYDVTLDTPVGFVVGATGGHPVREEAQDGRLRTTFHQEDVHDFAWVADPDYRRYSRTFSGRAWQDHALIDRHAKALGRDARSMDLTDVEVILLLHPEHDTDALRERHFDATFQALRFYGSRYGRYPYPYVTVVDPATDGQLRGFGGGMEYPTLFTCGAPLIAHARANAPESVTIHECGHQFWYGLSANNEFEEAWLDEGLNTYSEARCQDLAYAARRPVLVTAFGQLPFQGNRPALAPLPGEAAGRLFQLPAIPGLPKEYGFTGTLLHDVMPLRALREAPFLTYGREARTQRLYFDRARYLGAPQLDRLVRNGWEYVDAASYRVNSYHRPATLLNAMERLVGQDAWWTFLRLFHEQSRFRRPTTEEFATLLGQRTDAATEALFRQHITGSGRLDYGIERVDRERTRAGGWRSEVVVRRRGDMVVPIQVRLLFAGRPEPVAREWPAQDQYFWQKWAFEDTAGESFGELVEVRVDPPLPEGRAELGQGPAGIWVIDQNLLDNAWRSEPDHRPALARAGRSVLLLQSVATFFGLLR